MDYILYLNLHLRPNFRQIDVLMIVGSDTIDTNKMMYLFLGFNNIDSSYNNLQANKLLVTCYCDTLKP